MWITPQEFDREGGQLRQHEQAQDHQQVDRGEAPHFIAKGADDEVKAGRQADQRHARGHGAHLAQPGGSRGRRGHAGEAGLAGTAVSVPESPPARAQKQEEPAAITSARRVTTNAI